MSAALPQRDPAAEPSDLGADFASPSRDVSATTDLGGEPSGEPPRANNKREENALRKIQSDYDKLKNLVGDLTKSRWLQQLGPAGVAKALDQFEAILSDPSAQQLAARLAPNPDGSWGLSPAMRSAAAVDAGMNGTAGAGDEFVEPWEKAIEAKLSPLEKRLNDAIERLGSVATTNASEAVARHKRQVFSEYPLSPEQQEEVSERIDAKIRGLDPNVVMKLTQDQFLDHVAMPALRPHLADVFARKGAQKRSELSRFATDANGTPSLGAETRTSQPVRVKNLAELSRLTANLSRRAETDPG